MGPELRRRRSPLLVVLKYRRCGFNDTCLGFISIDLVPSLSSSFLVSYTEVFDEVLHSWTAKYFDVAATSRTFYPDEA